MSIGERVSVTEWRKSFAVAEGLTLRETRVALLLAEYATYATGDRIRPKVDTIAERLRMHPTHLWGSRGAIAGLVRKGWLVQTQAPTPNTPGHYRLSVGQTIVPEVCGDTPRDLADSARSQPDDLADSARSDLADLARSDLADLARHDLADLARGSLYYLRRDPSIDLAADPAPETDPAATDTEADADASEADADASEAKFIEAFNSNYPHERLGANPHLLKAACRKALGKTKGQVILEGLAWQVVEWQRLHGSDVTLVPWAGKWLADERWTDERPAPTPAPRKLTPWEANGYATEAEYSAWCVEDARRRRRERDGLCAHCDGPVVGDDGLCVSCAAEWAAVKRVYVEHVRLWDRPFMFDRAADGRWRRQNPDASDPWLVVPEPADPAEPDGFDPLDVPASWNATA